ncbi:MAG: DUF4911 domain-containing protein [bacterium]|nr:DUF4911 domain-containing protein [bacterium]
MVSVFGKSYLDDLTVVINIEIDPAKLVLIHALFESYDGMGVVKTLDEKRGIVSIITTKSCEPVCDELLLSLKEDLPWRYFEGEANLEDLFTYIEK